MKQLLEILYGNLDKKPILFLPIFFSLAFGIYYFSNLTPNDWYKHYVYLADSFIKGRIDVPQIPEFYQDVINFNGKKFLPFGPIPAVFLIPLVAFFGTSLSEVRVSMVIGAVNVVLVWLILSKLSLNSISRLLLTAGFAFGTVHFYAAITGTVWFFAHIMAVFFLLLAILEFFGKRRPVLLGFLTGFAFLSREPTLFASLFFLWPFIKEKQFNKITAFLFGIIPAIGFLSFYNFARFGSIFETGYDAVYNTYVNSGIKYSFLRTIVPESFPHFNQLDIRNIPLHLFTILLMWPNLSQSFPFFAPSSYGMSIFLTSPFLIYSIFARNYFVKICWLSILAIAIPGFLFYAQGWVQFGYRFLLDFLPFLLVLTALGFQKGSLKVKVMLVLFSITVNFWGIWWARTHGW